MGLLKNIYWDDQTTNTIVHKVNLNNDYISKGSVLTVRDSQVAIFSHKGKMADVFLPGFYKLNTESIPVITKLLSWKYGFENPFRSDVYFVNTKQFVNEKWGTSNPIIMRDADYGAIRIRGYGSFSFKIDDAFVFMTELSGTNSTFKKEDISDYLRSMVIMGISDVLGESKLPILDLAANLMELSRVVEISLKEDFNKIGLTLTKFNFENFSLPEELEKALDKSTSLGMMKNNMSTYMQMAQADALVEAAKNPGTAGSLMGAGIGFGMGQGMGRTFNNMTSDFSVPTEEFISCKECGTNVKKSAKFCPDCGKPAGNICPKCSASVNDGAKFCPECGEKLVRSCPKCNVTVKGGSKFCPECGEKL